MDDRSYVGGLGQDGAPDGNPDGAPDGAPDGGPDGGPQGAGDAVPPDDTDWYVVRCKPREDARAIENLGHQGFEAFAPGCLVTRRVGTVRRKVSEPMFPGYAFVRLSTTRHDWSVLRSTRGVMQLLRFGTTAPRVPASVIEGLKRIDGIDLDAKAAARLKVGDTVRLLDGPFAGLTGVYEQRDGMMRACVLLECMQRQVRVTVPDELLVRVG
jgi:transcriptional antiterminator RfaH